jgi:phasin family protein
MDKAYNDLAAYTQDTLDAFIRANTALTKGVEQLSKNFFALASHTLEEATEAGKRFTGVKSVAEAFELQTRYAQEAMDTLITESRKAQDISATIAKDAAAPFAERMKATMTSFAAAAYPSAAPASKKAA